MFYINPFSQCCHKSKYSITICILIQTYMSVSIKSLALKKEDRLLTFENTTLARISGPKSK
jgi:hypothetical protein